jgi:hypothetical protein
MFGLTNIKDLIIRKITAWYRECHQYLFKNEICFGAPMMIIICFGAPMMMILFWQPTYTDLTVSNIGLMGFLMCHIVTTMALSV